MADLIGKAMRGRRSLEAALNDLRIKYEQHPTAELSRMIQHRLLNFCLSHAR